MKKHVLLGGLLGLLLFGSQAAFCMKKKLAESETLCPELIDHDTFLIVLNFVSLKKMILLCAEGKIFNKQINTYLTNQKLNSQRIVHISSKMLKNAIDSEAHRKNLCAFLGRSKTKVSLDFSGNYIFDYSQVLVNPINIPEIISTIIDSCKEQLVELLIIRFIGKPKAKKKLFSELPKKLKRLSLKGYSTQQKDQFDPTNISSFQAFPITHNKLNHLSTLTHLHQLILDGIEYNKTQQLNYLSSLKNLRILYLKFSACLMEICLTPLQGLSKLKKLVLANKDIPQNQAFDMFKLLLSLGGSIEDDQLVNLPHNLEHLAITIPGITDKGVSSYIVHLIKLKSIALMGEKITRKSEKTLRKFLPDLKEIQIN